MSATILRFPQSAPCAVPVVAMMAPFSPAWCDQHLPLIDAAMDLLAADDTEFEQRCRLMRDGEGSMMLDDLTGQLERLGSYIAEVADGLGLVALRLRDAMIKIRRAPT